jgi:hypothetical protein
MYNIMEFVISMGVFAVVAIIFVIVVERMPTTPDPAPAV